MPNLVKGEGPKPAEIAIIGEGPGVWEDRLGRPSQGKAGQLMNFHLFKAGVNRELCWVDNIVPFRCSDDEGKDRPPNETEIKRHSQGLRVVLDEVQPKLIIAVGRTATRWFLGDVDMEAVHGIPIKTPRWVVIPCYHTAAALHDASGDMAAYVANDFQQVGLYLTRKIKARELKDAFPKPWYHLLQGAVAVRMAFGRHRPKRFPARFYIDTEGFPGRPWSIQVTFESGHGYMIRATDKEGLEAFLEEAQRYGYIWVIHNALYDLRLLLDMGMDLIALRIEFEDTMVIAYLTRLDPQGLKPLALRYAGMRMHSYRDLTGPYERKQLMDWLWQAVEHEYPKPDPVLERDSKTGDFKIRQPQNMAARITSILRDVDAGKIDKQTGEVVSPVKRWAQVEAPLRAQVEAVMGPTPVFSLDLVPIRAVIDYGCRDTDATSRIAPPLFDKLDALDLRGVYEMKRGILPMVERMMRIGFGINRQHFAGMREDIEREQDRLDREIKKVAGKWVNVDSPPQVSDLLFGKLGLLSERLTKKGRVPSTDDKTLESLVGTHPVVNLIIDRREAGTIDGFARDLPVFAGPDGRIRCTLRVTRVAQGRLAASKPNLLGIPVRSPLGARLRTGFTAQRGGHLGSADLSQIEMLVMADKSGDPVLIDEMLRGVDIHAQNAMDLLGATKEQSTLKEFREPAKRAGFGIITGITEQGLYEQMQLNHIKISKLACRDVLVNYLRKYRGIDKYIKDIRSKTRRLGYVRDSWGMLRYLPGVWSDIPYVRGEAERQSHSHDISGTAQGIIQRAMVRIWQRLVDEIWPAGIYCEILLQIHDELIWEGEGEPDSWQATLIAEIIREELVAESHLFKVPLKAKATTGLTWGDLK